MPSVVMPFGCVNVAAVPTPLTEPDAAVVPAKVVTTPAPAPMFSATPCRAPPICVPITTPLLPCVPVLVVPALVAPVLVVLVLAACRTRRFKNLTDFEIA